jgi:O-antigen/teichoic acid export membrane protein
MMFRSSAKLFLGTLLGQMIIFALTPWWAEVYDAQAFAFLAISSYASAITASFSTLSFDRAITSARTDKLARLAAKLSLTSALTISIGLGLAMFALSRFIKLDERLTYLSVVAPLLTLLNGLYITSTALMIRQKNTKAISRRNFMQGFSQAAFASFGALLAPVSWIFLALSPAIGRLGGISGNLSSIKFKRFRFKNYIVEIRTGFSALKAYPIVALPSKVVNSLGQNLSIISIFVFFPSIETASLALILRFFGGGIGFLSDALGIEFESKISNLVSKNLLSEIKNYFRHFMLGCLGISCVVLLMAISFGDTVLHSLFGMKWPNLEVMFFQILPIFFLQIAIVPATRVFYLLGKLKLNLLLDLTRFFIVFGSVTWSFLIESDFQTTLQIYIFATCIGYAVYGIGFVFGFPNRIITDKNDA